MCMHRCAYLYIYIYMYTHTHTHTHRSVKTVGGDNLDVGTKDFDGIRVGAVSMAAFEDDTEDESGAERGGGQKQIKKQLVSKLVYYSGY